MSGRLDPDYGDKLIQAYQQIITGDYGEVVQSSACRGFRELHAAFGQRALKAAVSILQTGKQPPWNRAYLVEVIEFAADRGKLSRYEYGSVEFEELKELLLTQLVIPYTSLENLWLHEADPVLALKINCIKVLARLNNFDTPVISILRELVLNDTKTEVQEASLWALSRLYVSVDGLPHLDDFLHFLTDYQTGDRLGRNAFLQRYAQDLQYNLRWLSPTEKIETFPPLTPISPPASTPGATILRIMVTGDSEEPLQVESRSAALKLYAKAGLSVQETPRSRLVRELNEQGYAEDGRGFGQLFCGSRPRTTFGRYGSNWKWLTTGTRLSKPCSACRPNCRPGLPSTMRTEESVPNVAQRSPGASVRWW